jgi:hypothetical protein
MGKGPIAQRDCGNRPASAVAIEPSARQELCSDGTLGGKRPRAHERRKLRPGEARSRAHEPRRREAGLVVVPVRVPTGPVVSDSLASGARTVSRPRGRTLNSSPDSSAAPVARRGHLLGITRRRACRSLRLPLRVFVTRALRGHEHGRPSVGSSVDRLDPPPHPRPVVSMNPDACGVHAVSPISEGKIRRYAVRPYATTLVSAMWALSATCVWRRPAARVRELSS